MSDPTKDDSSVARRSTRFEATLHRGSRHSRLERLPALHLDRLPGAPGETRVLLTTDEAARLVEMGFEVHLHRAHPIRPLDGALVADDERALAWLDERLKGIAKKGGR